MEAVNCKTSVDIYQTAQCYVSEVSNVKINFIKTSLRPYTITNDQN